MLITAEKVYSVLPTQAEALIPRLSVLHPSTSMTTSQNVVYNEDEGSGGLSQKSKLSGILVRTYGGHDSKVSKTFYPYYPTTTMKLR